ncbi:MAG: hypothetical protein SPI15_06370 [Candidatus Faecousia sp.]|nr:hypothetical protein [Clostridiales bacterium]MDY6180461.1 hypothetical protein [Candidatus Faecousia sp.]
MLRRDLRKIYRSFSPDADQKEALQAAILENRPKGTDIKGKKWKPKGQTRIRLTAALIVLLVLAGGIYAAWHFGLLTQAYQAVLEYRQERVQEQNTTPSEAPPTEEQDSEQTVLESYKTLVSKYRTAIRENWDATRCMEEDISILVTFLTEPDQLSAVRMDLDENGVPELVITDGNVIYDLYAYVEGKAVHVLSGAERNRYSLTAANEIVNVGSNGAASTVYTFYRYSMGNLIVDQRVIFDAGVDPENPWFRGFGEVEDADPISEDDANAIIDSYPTVEIPCVPITEYA